MSLIVQKFGGSSLSDARRLCTAARRAADTCKKGNQVVVVVSAQGRTTDRLIEKARELWPQPPVRELDALLSTGEQASSALMAMAVTAMGCPAVSLTGWQSGIQTDDVYGNARILKVEASRIRQELSKGMVVVAAGFQGISPGQDITTLGRGGSDTTAVALGAALGAEKCQIFTDVDGIFTADPAVVPQAVKLREISCDTMLELAAMGARVLHDRSVALAKQYHVTVEVLSASGNCEGTQLIPSSQQTGLWGITADRTVLLCPVEGQEEGAKLCCRMGQAGIRADGAFREAEASLLVLPEKQWEQAARLGQEQGLSLTAQSGWARITAAGQGLMTIPLLEKEFYDAMEKAGIAYGESWLMNQRFSVLVPVHQADEAIRALHPVVLRYLPVSVYEPPADL